MKCGAARLFRRGARKGFGESQVLQEGRGGTLGLEGACHVANTVIHDLRHRADMLPTAVAGAALGGRERSGGVECFLESIRRNRADVMNHAGTMQNPGEGVRICSVRVSTLAAQIHPKTRLKTPRGLGRTDWSKHFSTG